MQRTASTETPKHKKHRKHTNFSANVTASLALPDTPPLEANPPQITSTADIFTSIYNFIHPYLPSAPSLPWITSLMPARPPALTLPNLAPTEPVERDEATLKIKAIKYLIKEHAERRVDLFFYLLVAVYKKNVVIDKDRTLLQNGRGSAEHKTQACHSSLFPNISMRPAQGSGTVWQSIWNMVSKQLSAETKPASLEGTHFLESLNSTMELPKIVNDFDGKLEGGSEHSPFIDGCLLILNKASKGDIDPRQGMNDFFKLMEVFFDHYDRKKKNIGAMRKVWEYQKEGTFKAANKDMTLREDYLHMMLRIHPVDSRKVTMFSYVSRSVLEPYYKKVQDEIFAPRCHPGKF